MARDRRAATAVISTLRALWRRAAAAAVDLFAGERDRWALWLPVGIGLGIGAYFALPAEPPWWAGGAAVIAIVVAALVAAGPPARRRHVAIAAIAAGALATGFAVAQIRTLAVAAPTLVERIGPTALTGRVARLEVLADGSRATLERPRIAGLRPDRTPERVRVRLRGAPPPVEPGDWVRVRAVLTPPPAPAAPGAFDFQRRSYFLGLGAVGYTVGMPETVARAGDGGPAGVATRLARLRHAVSERARERIEGPTGAVIAALLTGERGAIPETVMTAIRDSGLAHLLAISGLHIGLVAGCLFLGVRAGLALIPPVALRYPIKKWAAGAAIVGAFAYAVLAGATVPSQRAFLMIGLVLLAVILDRRGLSMRLVAWAAVVVLVLQPESLLGASFQMSFAAVAALVAGYEAIAERRRGREPASGPGRRAIGYLAGIALTTLIASAATAPFAIHHFNRFAEYGLAANMLAVPVTALWIMPWAVAALALMPLGLDGLALVPMGWGVDLVIAVAETVAAWPGAVAVLPAMPGWGLAAVALGGAWLCLWRRRWRLAGAAAVAVGVGSMALVTPPDVLIDRDGKLLAVRGDGGALAVSSLRAAPFSRETWLRRVGQADEATPWPRHGRTADGRLACDPQGCVFRKDGLAVALARRGEALADDCALADVVVATVPVRRTCDRPRLVVDRFDLWRDGAHALWIEDGGVRVESVNGRRGTRPWVVRPRPRTAAGGGT